MTEAAALASIAKAALQTFSSLAKDELLLLWNSQKELKKLEDTINTLTNMASDAEGREPTGRTVQFLSRMRNAMYDAEDLFDGLSAQVLRKRTNGGNKFTKEVRLFFSESNQLGVIVKTAHAVKSIRESLDALKNDMEFNGLIPVTSAQQPVSVVSRETHSDVHEEDVIGREEDRDHVINMLLPQGIGETSNNQSLSVIAIIGFGGLGKTTLAKYVYDHESVKHGFDVHLWVCMKDLLDLKLVLTNIIGSYQKVDQSDSLEMLQKGLGNKISGKKYLLILDDLWNVTARNWVELKGVLRYGSEGSKVIVTTRSIAVANCLEASNRVDLAVLSDESAWSLFVKKAFASEEELRKNSELEPLGKEIVRRCGKVPLAVVIIGSLFRGMDKDMRTWSDFLENDLKRTIVMGGDKSRDSIKDVLMINYNHLLSNLKLCFAYCSLFPKGYIFEKDELVRLWIAQGFIKLDNGQTLEKEEEYFYRLVERCFFQDVKQKPEYFGDDKNVRYGKIAKMHDLLHDMATNVAKTECVLIDRASMVNRDERDNLRHISISCEVDNSFDYCSLASDPKRVRTLIIHSEKYFGKKKTVNLLLLSRFRRLRVLHLSRLRVENIESVGELTYLRYLDLSHNHDLVHLPDSICKLHQLMILVLVDCSCLKDLPPKIDKLVSLTQLYISGCYSLGSIPSGLTALTSLVKLDRFVVHRETGGLRYLQDLDNLLGILTIELPEEGWLDAVEDAGKANMSRKLKLSGMYINWTDMKDKKMHKDEAISVLDALKPHTNLEYLEISKYEGEILSIWVGTLRCVTELHLDNCNRMEYLLDDVSDFPSLKKITLKGLSNLKGWWRQVVEETRRPCYSKVSSVKVDNCPELKGQMPLFEEVEDLTLSDVDIELVKQFLNRRNNNLQKLRLSGIFDLVSMPEGWLRHLTHLRKLVIWECDNLEWVSCRGLAHLTALKDLELERGKITDIGDDDGMKMREPGMPWKALKGLVRLSVPGRDEHLLEGLQYLKSLESLEIENWIEEDVYDYINLKDQEWSDDETLKDEEVGDEETLKDEEVGDEENSEDEEWSDDETEEGGDEENLEDEEVAHPEELRNLKRLEIGFGKRTAHLPTFIQYQYLPSLKSLKIMYCKKLYLGWKSLLSRKLVQLEFDEVKKVIDVEEDNAVEQQSHLDYLYLGEACSLMENAQEAEWLNDVPWNSLSSSLHYLVLLGIEGIEQLPNGIQNLTSLQCLKIWGCEKLRSLPDWIPNLTSLGQLEIGNYYADQLENRCKEGGEDWHLIQHIPEKEIMESIYSISDGELEEEEEEDEGSRKKGGCGGLSLSKFKRIFH